MKQTPLQFRYSPPSIASWRSVLMATLDQAQQARVCLRHMIVTACLVSAILVSGCGRFSAVEEPTPSATPLEAMQEHVRYGRWGDAWSYAKSVESEYADDPSILAELARVAHENQDPMEASRLLVAACRAESYSQENRNVQAVVALIAVGRLYDGLDILAEALTKQPDQLESRRLLFDLLIGTENHALARPHGRYLVHKRRFDVELLTSLGNSEVRTLDPAPLNEMVARNSQDKRPLIGAAKVAFDKGQFDEVIQVSKQILELHPKDIPAQMLLGQALVLSGKYAELDAWAEALQGDYVSQGDYWFVIGEWALHRADHNSAVSAFWESTRLDPDRLQSWVRLRDAISQAEPSLDVPPESIDGIDQRIDQLSRLLEAEKRFTKNGGNSQVMAMEIAATLAELGRLWEAEAWASLALTFQEDLSPDATAKRETIVAQLRRSTPWQLTDRHLELQFDFSHLAPPAIAFKTEATHDSTNAPSMTDSASVPTTVFKIEDEAKQRGIDFFGKTGDQVASPGVPIYQTLGCGGGAVDYDLDGWPDVYLLAAGGIPPAYDSAPNGMFRNMGGTFSDVTTETETGDRGFGQGVAVGDVNEDGFADLLVLNYGPSSLLINQGDGTFINQTLNWLPDQQTRWSTSGAIADLNLDGIADAVIVNYCSGLEPITKVCGDPESAPGGISRSCSPLAFGAESDLFLAGRESGGWVDSSAAWDATPSILGRGLGISVGSFDGTPGIDLLVANDMTNNHYWSPSPESPFRLTESAIPRGLAGDRRSLAQGSMGIAAADMDRDGDIDFYVTNFASEYNTFYTRQTSASWQDQTVQAELATPTLPMVGFGSQPIDFDNDGTLELVVTNGHVDSYEDLSATSTYAQPLQIFRQDGVGKFQSVGESMGGEYESKHHVGRALWTLDANRDGKTDFFVTHQTEPVSLLLNHTPSGGNYVRVRVVGTKSSRDAVGTTIEVKAGEHSYFGTITAGDGYLCANERFLHFGLGKETTQVDVTIRWPDGSMQKSRGLSCNSEWLCVECDDPFRFTH